MAVVWHGVEWSQVLVFALLWYGAYFVCKAICLRVYVDHPKVVTQGASYGTAFLNACVCSAAGLCAILSLYDADTEVLSLMYPPEPFEAPLATYVVFIAVNSFFGWLLSDLVHLAVHYPTLGGADMVLHHVMYIICSAVATGFRIAPFVAGWLLSGEVSSLFLNTRWLLINSGRGDSRWLKRVEYAFALTFFLFRVVFFWGGMLHVVATELPFLLAPPQSAPLPPIVLLCVFIVCGAVLNVFWFWKIIKMAVRGGPPPPKKGEVRNLKSASFRPSPMGSPVGDNASELGSECSDMSVV